MHAHAMYMCAHIDVVIVCACVVEIVYTNFLMLIKT